MSPINSQDKVETKLYKPSKEDSDLVSKVMDRIANLKQHRSSLKANPYDTSPEARSIEDTWDFCDYVALPHKFYNTEMQAWMADNSHPIILSKIDTAVSVLAAKNPEVELVARSDKFETKTTILEALYNLTWDKGQGRQQLIKFINCCAKYGTAVGREFHLYRKREVEKIVSYDPDTGKHETEVQEIVDNDEPYFETLPIRDVFFDNRAKPYDENSIRDWAWTQVYDYSTFILDFPLNKFPNANKIVPSDGNQSADYTKDRGDVSNDIPGDKVRLWFYESLEDNEFIITDGIVLLHKGILLNNKLSCVIAMWKMRSEQTIYGIGLPEILENSDEMLNRITNMVQNQIMLSIGGAGYYGGIGNVTESDMMLEPKLKKLRDSDKIVFPKIPAPDPMVLNLISYIEDRADEYSGVTKSLGGEQVGKTLGEAVLNREAGLRRLQTPLQNIEFALERHGRLRIDLIQLIYSRPVKTKVIVNEFGGIINPELYAEYLKDLQELGPNDMKYIQKYPTLEDGSLARNQFKKERLGVAEDEKGEYENAKEDKLLEILPSEIEGDFDVRVRAFSTIPVSQSLEQSKAAETFQMIAQMPYTDLYKAQERLLKSRKEKPEDWMKTEEEIMETQDLAAQAQEQQGVMEEEQATQQQGQQAMKDQMEQAKLAKLQGEMQQGQMQPAVQEQLSTPQI